MTPDMSTAGFKLPSVRSLTENERGWIAFLRLVSKETEPPPTLSVIQTLQACLGKHLQDGGTG